MEERSNKDNELKCARYIGCLIDQFNYSEPFSLVVMTPDLESRDLGSRPSRGTPLDLLIYKYIKVIEKQ